MSTYVVRETFFRPDSECERERTSIPASLHNAMLSLRRELDGTGLFVPIRSMQYLAYIDQDEVIFVDAAGGYAHRDGQGGRLIRIAWRPTNKRDSLSAPVFCEVVYYFTGLKDVQRRLLGEFGSAVAKMIERRHADEIGVCECRILPFSAAR